MESRNKYCFLSHVQATLDGKGKNDVKGQEHRVFEKFNLINPRDELEKAACNSERDTVLHDYRIQVTKRMGKVKSVIQLKYVLLWLPGRWGLTKSPKKV